MRGFKSQCKKFFRMSKVLSKTQTVVVLVTIIILTFILLNYHTIWFAEENDAMFYDYRPEKPLKKPFKGEKLIHLDLKGAVPSISYLKKFFPLIKELGATGLLIEYEDMFPYKDELENIKALNAFNASAINAILDLAEASDLSVIPLIQTCGHLEFMLKLKEYRHLREVDKYPQVICLSNKDGFSVIQKMIDQILEAHPKAKYIHVGCDEVYYLGRCTKCKSHMKSKRWGEKDLFLNHIKKVAQYITNTHPSVRPIMWNDMLTIKMSKLIEKYKIADVMDIMVWSYKSDVSVDVSDDLLKIYGRLFKSIWIASAFKGATGVDQAVVDASYHLRNHVSWMELISKWGGYIKFKGIALTGWQRYDHFAVLCELLPVSIPSLALCLRYISALDKDIENTVTKILHCESYIPFSRSNLHYKKVPKCNFPGFPIYNVINEFYISVSNLKLPLTPILPGWISAYNVANKFSSPYQVERCFNNWHLNESRLYLKTLEKNLRESLLEVYDEYTVDEWITTRVTSLRIWLDAIQYSRDVLLEQREWPRRPFLRNSDEFLEKSSNEICSSNEQLACRLFF